MIGSGSIGSFGRLWNGRETEGNGLGTQAAVWPAEGSGGTAGRHPGITKAPGSSGQDMGAALPAEVLSTAAVRAPGEEKREKRME